MIDPSAGAASSPTTKHHLFCSGHALLPDGRVVIMGGHGDEVKAVHLFDPSTVTLSHHDDMQHGRWYPTVTVLPDGRAMVISGSRGTGPISAANPVNATSQVFDVTKPPRSRLSAEEATPCPALDEYRVPPSEPRKAVIAAAEASGRYPRLEARMGQILVETQDLAGRSVDRVRAVLADYDKTGSG